MDNSGTPTAAAAKGRPDTRAHTRREVPAWSGTHRPDNTLPQAFALLLQIRKLSMVRTRARAKNDIKWWHVWQDRLANDVSQAPFKPIPVNRVSTILRHDNADPWATKKGSGEPNLKVRGPESLPLLAHRLELSFPREPLGSRKAPLLRRRRTWKAV
jgi:hypothetical protein